MHRMPGVADNVNMDFARIQERRSYGNNLADHTYIIAHWSITHVALQFRLGILPERWFRARSTDHHHIAGPGTDMTSVASMQISFEGQN
jgi:hypothetical protein